MDHDTDDWFLSLVLEALTDSSKKIDPKELSKITAQAIPELLPEFAEVLLKILKSRSSKMLKERRLYHGQFKKRLIKKWKKPIDLLEMFLVISYEVGDEFNMEYRNKASKTHDYVFDVLRRMHARGCQLGFEILTLLKNGFADGAHARWRTLHEIAVISFFIQKHGQDIAKRFLHYESIETYKEALEYQKHCHKLGYKPLTEKELQEVKKRRDNALKIYGKDFGERYGWIPKNILTERNFREIEKSIELDMHRPFYKLASHNVHGGPKGLLFKLGLIQNNSEIELLLAGPSNFGLADPGQGSAISLYQITTCLLSTRPAMKWLITITTMQKLVDEIKSAFCKVQFQIEEECMHG